MSKQMLLLPYLSFCLSHTYFLPLECFLTSFLLFQVNEIAWNMKGDMFFLTTGNGQKIFVARKLYFFCIMEWLFDFIFCCLGTVEVLSYPSLRPLDTLMAHTAGCYCIAIDPIGRYPTNLSYSLRVFHLFTHGTQLYESSHFYLLF